MTNHEIPLFIKTYDLYGKIYNTCKKLPKQDRYNLGAKIEDCILTAFENIISAENLNGAEKLQYLRSAHTKIEILKVHIRLANDQKIITTKDYLTLEEGLQEIGKMLGGWIRYVKNQ